jgi:hypothetical protein
MKKKNMTLVSLQRSTHSLAVVLLTCVGCNQPAVSESTTQPQQLLDAGDAVTVIEDHGEYMRVETADGTNGYILSNRLQAPAGPAEVDSNEQLAITAPTPLLSRLPAPGTSPQSSAADETIPRTIEEIRRERVQLNGLYLSVDRSQEILRPKGGGPFLDQESGQICWQAWVCTNSECPSVRKANGPHIFPLVLKHLDFKAGGARPELDAIESGRCDACGTSSSIKPHLLPETRARMELLTDEYRQRRRWEREQQLKKTSGDRGAQRTTFRCETKNARSNAIACRNQPRAKSTTCAVSIGRRQPGVPAAQAGRAVHRSCERPDVLACVHVYEQGLSGPRSRRGSPCVSRSAELSDRSRRRHVLARQKRGAAWPRLSCMRSERWVATLCTSRDYRRTQETCRRAPAAVGVAAGESVERASA